MCVQKKIPTAAIVLFLVLLLSGCGKQQARTPWSAEEIWNAVQSTADFPEMISVPKERFGYMFGLQEEDFSQAIIAVSADSLRADEIWIIEAANEEATARVEALARDRLAQKEEETRSYAPEQYRIVQNAQLKRNGVHLVMVVSPLAQELLKQIPD